MFFCSDYMYIFEPFSRSISLIQNTRQIPLDALASTQRLVILQPQSSICS